MAGDALPGKPPSNRAKLTCRFSYSWPTVFERTLLRPNVNTSTCGPSACTDFTTAGHTLPWQCLRDGANPACRFSCFRTTPSTFWAERVRLQRSLGRCRGCSVCFDCCGMKTYDFDSIMMGHLFSHHAVRYGFLRSLTRSLRGNWTS